MTDQLKPCPACGWRMELETDGTGAWTLCQNFNCRLAGPTRAGLDADSQAIAASNDLPRGWQPIEQMPERLRDGRWVLFRNEDKDCKAMKWCLLHNDRSGWYGWDDSQPQEIDGEWDEYMEIAE